MSDESPAVAGTRDEIRSRTYRFLSRLGGRSLAGFVMRTGDMIRFLLGGFPRNVIGSIDITSRCNLKCRHCYFLVQGYQSELTDEQWIAKMDYLRDHTDFPFYQCSWVGGEPLLRKDLIENLMPRFKSNLITTNGSIPLPDWRACNFYVSVDGTREYYGRIRGKPELYERIKKNVLGAPQLRITAAMCIDSENWRCIPALLEEWRVTNIRAFIFQFFTPVEGVDEKLWLGWTLRDHVIDMLISLKQKYGDFITNPVDQLRLMKSAVAPSITRDCLYSRMAFSLGPDGKPKVPCMMGEKADCSRCGCILPFHTWLLQRRSLLIREVILALRRALYGRLRQRERERAKAAAALHNATPTVCSTGVNRVG